MFRALLRTVLHVVGGFEETGLREKEKTPRRGLSSDPSTGSHTSTSVQKAQTGEQFCDIYFFFFLVSCGYCGRDSHDGSYRVREQYNCVMRNCGRSRPLVSPSIKFTSARSLPVHRSFRSQNAAGRPARGPIAEPLEACRSSKYSREEEQKQPPIGKKRARIVTSTMQQFLI